MGNFNQNGVDFNISQYTPVKLNNRASTSTYTALVAGKGKEIINTVEIDWNNAYLGNSYYINTTGDLLSYISGLMQLAEYYEKPQKVIVTYNTTNKYKAVFDVYKTVNINNTNIPLVKKVSLTGKKSYAILDARYVPTIHDSSITWEESTKTNSYIVLTAKKDDNEGATHAIVKSNICYIRPNAVINEITKKDDYVSQNIKAYTNIPIYNDSSNPYAYKYVDVVISEGSISKISFPSNSTASRTVVASGGEIKLQCELEHDKFNLTADDCSYTKTADWVTYDKKTLSNDGLYEFTFKVSNNTGRTSRTTDITLHTLNASSATISIKYTITQDGRGEIITDVNSNVTGNKITLFTNGEPDSYQLAPSLEKK